MTVAIIHTGCANIFSVETALDRLGVPHILAEQPAEASGADRLILPGVGAARPAMEKLQSAGWDAALVAETRPLLGICLGMQLLFETSEEGGVECLGLLPGHVMAMAAFDGGRLPHMGWNRLHFEIADDPMLAGIDEGDHVYFVHGYAVPVTNHTVASSAHDMRFSAMVRRGSVMGCQFHPERSGKTGARILNNFLEFGA
ncbi:MAG: imidazole glycerol phosphate synthase subunit HisH [Alphaproteobacteria bacterium]|nr:imidazole glycerol phosphate synthase subunit HisH [Alphaproteobacteria bacterium]